jgi:hypothetical protein
MDKISHLCNERVAKLTAEEGGEALLAFHAPPNEATGIRLILRQDHPEVLDFPILSVTLFCCVFAFTLDS